MDEISLGKRLQKARKSVGLTQQELCEKTGLSYSTLAKIERGAIKSPSIFTIQQISEAVGRSIDDIIGSGGQNTRGAPKKRSKTGIEFVYFDINGCLVRFYYRAFTQIAHDSGKSPDIIESTFWHYNDAVCRGELPMDEFNDKLAKEFDQPGFKWQKYYLESVESVPGMLELLEWCSQHYRIGLLSNIMPGLIDSLIKKGLIPDIEYEAIIDSSQSGAIKPEAKIFELATQASQANTESILLIDDSRANLMAAEKFGWKVLWFDDYNSKDSIDRVKTALKF